MELDTQLNAINLELQQCKQLGDAYSEEHKKLVNARQEYGEN
jgi:hypothetical protein